MSGLFAIETLIRGAKVIDNTELIEGGGVHWGEAPLNEGSAEVITSEFCIFGNLGWAAGCREQHED
jgi:hypothetical protein